MVYITLIALLFSITNFIPVSAIGFAPICLCAWRLFDRRYPPFVTCLSVFGLLALGSTLLYDPQALLSYDFYRHDGNFFVSYAPILAGCLYSHELDLDKALRRFFVFAVLANLPPYAVYVAQNGLLAIFSNANDSFGSYFIARNAAGGFLAMLFCLGLSCYVKRPDRLVLGLLVLNAMFVFSTYSRGSMLGVATAIAYLLLGRKRWLVAVLMAGQWRSPSARPGTTRNRQSTTWPTSTRCGMRTLKRPMWTCASDGSGRGHWRISRQARSSGWVSGRSTTKCMTS